MTLSGFNSASAGSNGGIKSERMLRTPAVCGERTVQYSVSVTSMAWGRRKVNNQAAH